eukprot:SAG22_NODE_536_length_9364_cov_15.973988_3_plen_162_part_00
MRLLFPRIFRFLFPLLFPLYLLHLVLLLNRLLARMGRGCNSVCSGTVVQLPAQTGTRREATLLLSTPAALGGPGPVELLKIVCSEFYTAKYVTAVASRGSMLSLYNYGSHVITSPVFKVARPALLIAVEYRGTVRFGTHCIHACYFKIVYTSMYMCVTLVI